MMNKALQDPEFITVAIPERPWLYFIKSIIPHGVTMIATFLLFLKRTKTTSVEQEPQD